MYKLRLKELRKAAGFKTQKDIAAYLGIKERRYASWEREEVALTLEDAYTLALALGCTPNDLCGWETETPRGDAARDVSEDELLRCYRSSTVDRQARILDTARDAAAISKDMAERPIHASQTKAG